MALSDACQQPQLFPENGEPAADGLSRSLYWSIAFVAAKITIFCDSVASYTTNFKTSYTTISNIFSMDQNTIQAPAEEQQQPQSCLPSWATNYMDVGQISRLIPFYSIRMIQYRAKRGTMPFPLQKIGRSWYALKADVESYWREQQAAFANGQQPQQVQP